MRTVTWAGTGAECECEEQREVGGLELLEEKGERSKKHVQKGNHGLSATRFRSERDPCTHTEQSRAVDLTERREEKMGKMGGRRKGAHTPPAPHFYERGLSKCYAFSLSARESLTRLPTGGRRPFPWRVSSQAASQERSLCSTEHPWNL